MAEDRTAAELLSLAHEIGAVIDVAQRRSDRDHDHRQMIARLTMWRSRLLDLQPILTRPATDMTSTTLAQLRQQIEALPRYAVMGDRRGAMIEWPAGEFLFRDAVLRLVQQHIKALEPVPVTRVCGICSGPVTLENLRHPFPLCDSCESKP